MTAILSEAPLKRTSDTLASPQFQPNHAEPVRICFLIDQLRTGGTESQLLRLVEGLDRERFEPYLVLLDGDDPTSQALEPENCPTQRLGVRVLARPSTGVACANFARQLARWRIDVLQVFFPDSTYFGVLAGRMAGVPHIVRTRRDLFYWVTPVHRRWGRHLDGLYNRFFVDALITNSQACREAAIQAETPPVKHITVIENGIDLQQFAGVRPLEAHNGRMLQIGAVGMLRPEKRFDLLVEAAAILQGRGLNAKFTIVGEGPERSRLEGLIARHGLQERFHLPGLAQNIPRFLSQVDIAVLCSDTEGLSNSLLEYMAAGRAVIATGVGGNVELIEEGRSGLLVPPSDAASLSEALRRLMQSPSMCIELGNAAREKINTQYSMAAMIRRHEAFYTQLVSQRSGRSARTQQVHNGQSRTDEA